jgi:hypothetical protein
MKIVQVYLVEAKRLYIKNCIEEGYDPEQKVLDRFDELVKQEGKKSDI